MMSIVITYYERDTDNTISECFNAFRFRFRLSCVIDARVARAPEQFKKIDFWKEFSHILRTQKEFFVHVQSVGLLLHLISEAGIYIRDHIPGKYASCVVYTEDRSVQDLTQSLSNLHFDGLSLCKIAVEKK